VSVWSRGGLRVNPQGAVGGGGSEGAAFVVKSHAHANLEIKGKE